jgi:hypothetical protein
MNGIGIKRSNGIELVDATVVNDSIIPSQCPGDLGIPCNACSHAWTEGVRAVNNTWHKRMRFPFMLCHWHEQANPEHTPPSSDGTS